MPESGTTKHNYLFCQFVNPACGHEGDRCDCFDTPSQRRTTLAKQRLAQLQALKKLSQCLAILQRLSYRKSNKLHNNLNIINIILGHLGFRTSSMSCDLV